MSKGINFNGFEHFSRGNADVEVIDDKLSISGMIKNTDGVIINTNGVSGMEIEFEPYEIREGETFGATFNMRDKLGRIKTIAQWAISKKKGEKYARLMVNSRLEGENIQVIGMKDNKVVFVQNILNDNKDPYCNWVQVVAYIVAIAYATDVALSKVDIKVKRRIYKDKNGNIIKVEESRELSFGGGNVSAPQISFHASPNPRISNSFVEIDNLYVVSSREFPGEMNNDLTGKIEEVVLMTNSPRPILITNEYIKNKTVYDEITCKEDDDTEVIVCNR